LNHVSGRSALDRTYDRYDYAPEVIAALLRWQAHVEALIGDAPPAKAARNHPAEMTKHNGAVSK
jgi:hypothetical protein